MNAKQTEFDVAIDLAMRKKTATRRRPIKRNGLIRIDDDVVAELEIATVSGGPGTRNPSIPIWFYYRIRDPNTCVIREPSTRTPLR